MSSSLIRTLDVLETIESTIPAGTVLAGEAARAQDAEVAVADARLVLAGMEEYLALVQRDLHDAANVQDIATDLLPRLTALQAFLVEQVAEVTR